MPCGFMIHQRGQESHRNPPVGIAIARYTDEIEGIAEKQDDLELLPDIQHLFHPWNQQRCWN